MIFLLVCLCQISCPHHLWFDYPNRIRRGVAITKLYEAFHYAVFLIIMLFFPSRVQISYSTPCSRKWFVCVPSAMWQAKLHLHVKQRKIVILDVKEEKDILNLDLLLTAGKRSTEEKNVYTKGILTDFILITWVIFIGSHTLCQWKRVTQSNTYSTWVIHSNSFFEWSYWILLARTTGSCLIHFVVSCPSLALYFAWWLRCRASIIRISRISSVHLLHCIPLLLLPVLTLNISAWNLTCALCVRNILVCLL
jgi:hypothetical protein